MVTTFIENYNIKNRLIYFISNILPTIILISNSLLFLSAIIIFIFNITNIAAIQLIVISALLLSFALSYLYHNKKTLPSRKINKMFSHDRLQDENSLIAILINAYLLFQSLCIIFSAFGCSLILSAPLALTLLAILSITYVYLKQSESNYKNYHLEIINIDRIILLKASTKAILLSIALFAFLFGACYLLVMVKSLMFLYPLFIVSVPILVVAAFFGITNYYYCAKIVGSQVKSGDNFILSLNIMRNISLSSFACFTVLTQLNITTFAVAKLSIMLAILVSLKFLPVIIALAFVITAGAKLHSVMQKNNAGIEYDTLIRSSIKASDMVIEMVHLSNASSSNEDLQQSSINTLQNLLK